jgi:glyoxylase-like metal-dependent hydrolase (beta-lactamase superfamily II)
MRNFVYLIDDEAGAGALVDPAFEVPRLLAEAKARGVRVDAILATHGHPDHVNGIPAAASATGAPVYAHRSADHKPVDHPLDDGAVFHVGRVEVKAIHTPGHRFDAVCYLVDGTHLLTGDTLFVGECGRVDLPGSSVPDMHRSLVTTLRALPDDLVVLPGHDYGKTPTSTLGHEKRTNYTMQPRTLDEFARFMAEP